VIHEENKLQTISNSLNSNEIVETKKQYIHQPSKESNNWSGSSARNIKSSDRGL